VRIKRVQADGQGFLLQSRAAAGVAELIGHVGVQLVLHPFALGVLEAALQVGDDAFEIGAGPFIAFHIRAVHQDVFDLFRVVLVRVGVRAAEVATERQHAAVKDVHPLAVLPPRFDAPFERQAHR
jgi:hypothetical protein